VASKSQLGPELPPSLAVPSDDCTVEIDGKPYHIHRGQTVWISGVRQVGEMQSTWRFNSLSLQMDSLRPDPVELPPNASDAEKEAAEIEMQKRWEASNRDTFALLDKHFEDLLAWMAPRVDDWDWTDARGRPLPKPDGTKEPLRNLSTDELHWLRSALRGETPKNGRSA
jgi:hypothetical protein